jgi:hypothetical protein
MAKKMKIPDWAIVAGAGALFVGGIAAYNMWGKKTTSSGVGAMDDEYGGSPEAQEFEREKFETRSALQTAKQARQAARAARATAREQRAMERQARSAADRHAQVAAAKERIADSAEQEAVHREALAAQKARALDIYA